MAKDGEWRKTWILVARSSLLGDPYFLDVSKLDAEGDCSVYTAMSGAGKWEPRLCGSTFAQFLRILAAEHGSRTRVRRGHHGRR